MNNTCDPRPVHELFGQPPPAATGRERLVAAVSAVDRDPDRSGRQIADKERRDGVGPRHGDLDRLAGVLLA
ncbi:MAG: hypothetical protein ACNA8P_13095, partial [Phycisphaerales bacterium]